jgi:hypothetical protein
VRTCWFWTPHLLSSLHTFPSSVDPVANRFRAPLRPLRYSTQPRNVCFSQEIDQGSCLQEEGFSIASSIHHHDLCAYLFCFSLFPSPKTSTPHSWVTPRRPNVLHIVCSVSHRCVSTSFPSWTRSGGLLTPTAMSPAPAMLFFS